MKNFLSLVIFIANFLVFVCLSFFASYSNADDIVYKNPKYFDTGEKKANDLKVNIPETAITKVTPKPSEAKTEEVKNEEKKVNYNSPSDDEFKTFDHPVSEVEYSDLNSKQPQVKTECDRDNNICLTAYVYDDRVILEVENKTVAARTFNIEYTLNNMKILNGSDRKNIILKAGEKKPFDTLVPVDKENNFGYNYNYSSVLGVVDAVHDDNYEYDLPFDTGQKFMLIQGIGGEFSHNDEENYYSYDFKMPIGTPILAARDGVVVKIIDKFVDGGVNPSLKKRANYIYIQHADGTIADYTHIKYKGALVNIGDFVQKGQKIALSGNTGYTTNPHLHFGVIKAVKGGKFISVPIKVKNKQGVLQKLKVGDYYEK